MALPFHRFLCPIYFATANPTLRVRTGGVDETLTLSVAVDAAHWMSGDGQTAAGKRDLVERWQTMLRTATGGADYAASLSDEGFLLTEHLGGTLFSLLFEHAASTLDQTIFGFPKYDTASASEQDGVYQVKGLWQPERAHKDDTDDLPVRLGSRVEAAGEGGSRTFLGEVLKYERQIFYDRLDEARVVEFAAPDNKPYGTLENAWVAQKMDGGPIRVYDQHTVPELYRTYTPMPGRIWRQMKKSVLKYEAELDLVRTEALQQINAWSLQMSGSASGDGALAPDHSTYDLTTRATWSYWLKRDAAGAGDQYNLTRISGADNAWAFGFPLAGTELRGYICSSGSDVSNFGTTSGLAFPTSGVWRHIAWVYDGSLAAGSRLRLYVDGVNVALTITGTIPATIRASALGIRIGAGNNATDSNFGPGNIGQVSIWNVAKTAAQINAEIRDSNNRPRRLLKVVKWRMTPPTGLIAYFPLQNNFLDRSSTANNAGRFGTPTFEAEVP